MEREKNWKNEDENEKRRWKNFVPKDDPYCCGNCKKRYTQNSRPPFSLLCGDTFCRKCISQLQKVAVSSYRASGPLSELVICSECRVKSCSEQMRKNVQLYDILLRENRLELTDDDDYDDSPDPINSRTRSHKNGYNGHELDYKSVSNPTKSDEREQRELHLKEERGRDTQRRHSSLPVKNNVRSVSLRRSDRNDSRTRHFSPKRHRSPIPGHSRHYLEHSIKSATEVLAPFSTATRAAYIQSPSNFRPNFKQAHDSFNHRATRRPHPYVTNIKSVPANTAGSSGKTLIDSSREQTRWQQEIITERNNNTSRVHLRERNCKASSTSSTSTTNSVIADLPQFKQSAGDFNNGLSTNYYNSKNAGLETLQFANKRNASSEFSAKKIITSPQNASLQRTSGTSGTPKSPNTNM